MVSSMIAHIAAGSGKDESETAKGLASAEEVMYGIKRMNKVAPIMLRIFQKSVLVLIMGLLRLNKWGCPSNCWNGPDSLITIRPG